MAQGCWALEVCYTRKCLFPHSHGLVDQTQTGNEWLGREPKTAQGNLTLDPQHPNIPTITSVLVSQAAFAEHSMQSAGSSGHVTTSS